MSQTKKTVDVKWNDDGQTYAFKADGFDVHGGDLVTVQDRNGIHKDLVVRKVHTGSDAKIHATKSIIAVKKQEYVEWAKVAQFGNHTAILAGYDKNNTNKSRCLAGDVFNKTYSRKSLKEKSMSVAAVTSFLTKNLLKRPFVSFPKSVFNYVVARQVKTLLKPGEKTIRWGLFVGLLAAVGFSTIRPQQTFDVVKPYLPELPTISVQWESDIEA